jgi:predicted CoA-substrate-specific enzyme activase
MGGQDTKAIALAPDGGVEDFEMNDRCAAGTGKFLEIMAEALGLRIDELGQAALRADGSAQVSSMCTVFAESEVVGLLHRGEPRERVALGLHEAIARRTVAMLKRVGAAGPLLFAGGVAHNPAMRRLIAQGYGGPVVTASQPQLVGALGAALHGAALKGGDPRAGEVHGGQMHGTDLHGAAADRATRRSGPGTHRR